jgi:hypothetical protein
MVGRADVLLDLVELVGLDDGEGIFLPVHCARLERSLQLHERHRHRVRFQCLERIEEYRIGDHAQLDAGQILGLGDRPLAVGHVAKAQVPVAQRDESLFRQFGKQRLAERAIEQCVGLREVADREGKVDEPELLDDAGPEMSSQAPTSSARRLAGPTAAASRCPRRMPGNSMRFARNRVEAHSLDDFGTEFLSGVLFYIVGTEVRL